MRSSLAGAAALTLTLALGGCHSLDAHPPSTPVALAGHWREDTAASDDFERKLGEVVAHERQRLQPHPAAPVARTGPGGGPAGAGVAPLVPPMEPVEKERSRLGDDLRPAASLRIAFVGETVEITRDAEPVRSFQPGQTVARIDSSGAASVTSGWDQRAFEIRARYTDGASRSWRLEIDPATDTLRLHFQADDPEFGHVVLNTVYRRAP
jgi:hypothetical protein